MLIQFPFFIVSLSHPHRDFFRSHLYADMERVSKIWEIELQAVLEINKLGHRKRILYSVAERNKLLPPNLEEINGVDSVCLAGCFNTKNKNYNK